QSVSTIGTIVPRLFYHGTDQTVEAIGRCCIAKKLGRAELFWFQCTIAIGIQAYVQPQSTIGTVLPGFHRRGHDEARQSICAIAAVLSIGTIGSIDPIQSVGPILGSTGQKAQ